MKNILADLIQILQLHSDLDVSRYDDAFLMQCLNRRLEHTQMQDLPSYLSYLVQNESERNAFILTLNNSHTDFFRAGMVFAQLEHYILPGMVDHLLSGQELRIWSAGCSTGQEPYSLAILLENLAASMRNPVRYRIFATDNSAASLETARQGVYSEEAVQNLRLKDLTSYFNRVNNTYSIVDRIRKHISFSYYDLFDPVSSIPPESIFGNFNLVVCCNVLFYYNEISQKVIINKLVNSIMDNGYFITGEAERIRANRSTGLCAVSSSNPIFRRVFEVRHETN